MRRTVPSVVLVALLALGTTGAQEGGRSGDRPSEGRQPMDLGEVLDAQRQSARKLERSPSGARDLDRRKMNHTRDRIGPVNWRLHSDW